MTKLAPYTAIALIAALSSAPQPLKAQVHTADPAKRGIALSEFPRFVKLAENVYGYEEIRAPGFTTVSLVVVGANGVLIADAQGSVEATRTMLDKIRTLTPRPVKWYVVGSDHGDHTAGNSELPKDVRYIVHATSLAQLKRDSAAATPPREVVVPTSAMKANSETIDVGGKRVVVRFLGRAHTGGDLMLEIPEDGILFMSEAFLNRVFPAMRSAYPSEWVAMVDKALAMPGIKRFVAGHGFIESPARSREELVAYRDAMKAVIAEVKKLHDSGMSVDEAVKVAKFGEYGDWFLADSQQPIAVRRIYDELNGKLR